MSYSMDKLVSIITENIEEVKQLKPENIMEAQKQYKIIPFLNYEEALAESVAMKNGEHKNFQIKNAFFSMINSQDSYWQKKGPMGKLRANDVNFDKYVKLQGKTCFPSLMKRYIDKRVEHYDVNNPIHTLVPIHDHYYKKMRIGEYSVQKVYEGLCEEFSRDRVFYDDYENNSLAEILYASFLIQEKYYPSIGQKNGYYGIYRAFGGDEKYCITYKDLTNVLPKYFKQTFIRALSISIMGWILSDIAEIETEKYILSLTEEEITSRDASYSEDYEADSDFIIIDNKYNNQEIRISIKSGFRNLKVETLEGLRGRKYAYKMIGLYAGPTTFKVPDNDNSGYCSDFLIFGINKNGEVRGLRPAHVEKYIECFTYERLSKGQDNYDRIYHSYR